MSAALSPAAAGHAQDDAGGLIGPNAITRVAEALQRLAGQQVAADLFEQAGLAGWLARPPTAMVDERAACRLHGLLRRELGDRLGKAVAREAGVATADYLLAHRLPRALQALLRRVPSTWACRLLLAAISRHAWTFAGSGRFDAHAGRPARLTIRGNPLCRGQRGEQPVCDYYAATFERLFQVLVHPATRVTELSCEARGDDACRFELRW
ncbi:MAG: bacteriochlorophyll 4-vinyl reductase [Burkholderiaceae bacterium]